jgi:hypothetical protein
MTIEKLFIYVGFALFMCYMLRAIIDELQLMIRNFQELKAKLKERNHEDH